MLKKLGVVAIGVTAGLAAAAPLASASEAAPDVTSHAGATHATSSSPATLEAPTGDDHLGGVLDQSNTDLGSNAQSLSGNSGFLNGHDLAL